MMTTGQKVTSVARRFPTWPVYLFGLAMPCWLLWLGLTGGLGVEPISELEHRLGKLTLQMLVVTLLITPLRDLLYINLIKFRRALGLVAFFWAFLHFLVWLVLDVQILSQVWADILKRPYVTVGFASLLLLIPVALTSNNLSIRKLGPKVWRRLHMLSYGAIALGVVHYIMLTRGFQIEPLVYAGMVAALLVYRIPWMRLAQGRRQRV